MYNEKYPDSISFATPVLSKNLGQEIYVKRDTRTLALVELFKRVMTTNTYGKTRRDLFESYR